MNKYMLREACLPIALLVMTLVASAVLIGTNKAYGAEPGTCLFDGKVIDNCAVIADANGNEPNVLVRWVMPTEREMCIEFDQNDSTVCKAWQPLSLDEIEKVRVYFVTPENGWSSVDVLDHRTAVALYKAPGTYDFLATTFDTDGRESKASERKTMTVADGPTLIIVGPPKEPREIIINRP